MTRISEVEYRPDSTQCFGNLTELPFSVFLDSGRPSSFASRYDILTADPYITLCTRGGQTEIHSDLGTEVSDDDPLVLLERCLGERMPDDAALPFIGGAIVCFSYDLGRRFERVPSIAARDIDFPDMVAGIYDWGCVVDHHEKRAFLASGDRYPGTRARWSDLLERVSRPAPASGDPFEVVSDVTANVTREAYADAFDRVQEHIRVGDCYQVNLAQRFEARVRGDSLSAYRALRDINPAPFSACLNTPYGDVLSSSPERFLNVVGDRIETKPIKGTRPRRSSQAQDQVMRDELVRSRKDRAENVMIVDLLRNDLGKVCAAGSVNVTKLFDIESFAQVHHMVSTVSGRLAADRHPLDLVRACFPGGSITGAPKLRAMEIIDALELTRRSVYCGSLGYLSYSGRMDLNIAIRTLLRVDKSIYAWAGGGIVADSDCEAEYQESLDKASGLLAVLARSQVSAAVS